MIRYCYECRSEQEVSVIKKQESFPVKGVPIETVSDVVVCQACGEEIFDEELDGKNMDRVYEKHHRMKGIIDTKLTDEELEHRIAQVNATMDMEGMALTDNDKETLRKFARGELTMEQVIEQALAETGKKKDS